MENQYGETLEFVSGLILNLDHWDCECEEKYIHHISIEKCLVCNSAQEDQPSSREPEVLELVKR